MNLTERDWRRNFLAFLWHAAFLALASSFMDVGTVIPAMLLKVGGTSTHLGLLTAIMLGGASFTQLVFAGLLSGRPRKKGFLLWGIHLRVAALLLIALLFQHSVGRSGGLVILAIFVLISVFSFSGAFANVSYVDILGKSVRRESRKRFFSSKQVINSIGILASALVARELLKHLDYPHNYALLFLLAGLLLWIATAGFWSLREAHVESDDRPGFGRFLAAIPREIRANRNLRNYLLVVNSLGVGLGMLPFTVLLAKERFGLEAGLIGNLLLLRTLGMLVAGLVLYRIAKRVVYRHVLVFSLVVGALIPVLCLVLQGSQAAYQWVFLLAGAFAAVYQMSIQGVLLEISTDHNRALYAGISGAGNVLTALFPVLAGWLIPQVGFTVLFPAVAALIAASWFFVRKLDCRTAPPA